MNKLEYLHTPKFLIRDSLNYNFQKVFEFEFEANKLKTKNSISYEEVLDFQKKLIEAKRRNRRRIFKTDIVLECEIYINQRNAPSIQNIPKCYIDLLWRPHPDLGKQKLMLYDDSQIKYLFVNYRKSESNNSKLKFRAIPIRRFKKDLELINRLRSGIFKYDFYSSDITEDEPEREEMHRENHEFYDLVDHIKDKEFLIEKFGSDYFYYWELFYKRAVQEIELNNQRIKNRQILDLLSRDIEIDSQIPYLSKEEPLISDEYLIELNDHLFDIMGDFDIENFPIRQGESTKFKALIQQKVDEYFENRWYYLPMLHPIAITIFVLPPENMVKDFDNIAKWILPLYMQKLNPPTSFVNSLQEIELFRLKKNPKSPPFTEKSGDFPKNGILSYQIIQLPKLKKLTNKGFIKVNLHNGLYYRSFPNYLINEIARYEDAFD